MTGTQLVNLVQTGMVVASATAAVWHKAIDGATYAALVAGALGIGGVIHKSSGIQSG